MASNCVNLYQGFVYPEAISEKEACVKFHFVSPRPKETGFKPHPHHSMTPRDEEQD